MPASDEYGFFVEEIFNIMGSQSLRHLGALSVRLSSGSLVLFGHVL